jgi:hypothetical protein
MFDKKKSLSPVDCFMAGFVFAVWSHQFVLYGWVLCLWCLLRFAWPQIPSLLRAAGSLALGMSLFSCTAVVLGQAPLADAIHPGITMVAAILMLMSRGKPWIYLLMASCTAMVILVTTKVMSSPQPLPDLARRGSTAVLLIELLIIGLLVFYLRAWTKKGENQSEVSEVESSDEDRDS